MIINNKKIKYFLMIIMSMLFIVNIYSNFGLELNEDNITIPLDENIAYNNIDIVPIINITKLSYDNIIFLEYEDNVPIFYKNDIKKYYIQPKIIYPIGINKSVVKNLGFKISNKNYDIIISNKYINTNKDAIFFIPINGSKKLNGSYNNITKIYWKVDPLYLNKSFVVGKYTLPKKGEIIATYENGEPAIIKVGNKIYSGVEPNNEVILNLVYIYMIKKNPFDGILSLIMAIIAIILGSYILYWILNKIIELFNNNNIAKLLIGTLVVGRISINDEEKVLLNDTRREIYEYILDNPGTHLREISKNLNKGIGTITWHLRILEKANLIYSKKVGNKIIYLPKGMDISDVPLLYLNNSTSKIIFDYLKHSSAHLRKISKELKMPAETVRYHLKKMEELGIVHKRVEGNKIIYELNPNYID